MYGYQYSDELYHYGVKGMKWGVRRGPQLATSETRRKFDSAKADLKSAKKAYKKSYNNAYRYSDRHPISQFVSKKVSAEADRRWQDTHKKAVKAYDAKKAYKQAKAERKQQIKDSYNAVNKQTTLKDRLIYNDATRKKAAKYMVDNNMSMKDANERAKGDAKRNTAVILGAYGAVTVAALYANSKM